MTGIHAFGRVNSLEGGNWMEKYISAKINYNKKPGFSWIPQESQDSEARVIMESKDGALGWKQGKWLR